jgi:hypothetical protein
MAPITITVTFEGESWSYLKDQLHAFLDNAPRTSQEAQEPSLSGPITPPIGTAGTHVVCAFCGGQTLDLRNAEGRTQTTPAFRCADRKSCKAAAWLKKSGELTWKK